MDSKAIALANAVLLFLRGGPWTPQDHDHWKQLTNGRMATTKTLGDMARAIIDGDKDND